MTMPEEEKGNKSETDRYGLEGLEEWVSGLERFAGMTDKELEAYLREQNTMTEIFLGQVRELLDRMGKVTTEEQFDMIADEFEKAAPNVDARSRAIRLLGKRFWRDSREHGGERGGE